MKNFWIILVLFIPACGGEKYADPGTLEGRMDQVCECFAEKTSESTEKECFDLQNKYFELTEGNDKWKFIERMERCMSEPKK